MSDKLARVFAKKMLAEIGAENMAIVVAKNNGNSNPHICHTHDFCDANMVMLAAAAEVAGVDEDNIDIQENLEIFNAAWALAKAEHFWVV